MSNDHKELITLFEDMSNGEVRAEMLSFKGTYGYTALCAQELIRREKARKVAACRARTRLYGPDDSWVRLAGGDVCVRE
jgi:hypothetical protein